MWRVRMRQVDEKVARRVNARRTGQGVDRFWRLVSSTANHGKLWFAAAAVLMLLGKPRAAARGLASLGVASLVANLIGKRLIGGERPALTSIPISRRLQRTPTSPSFPSGHTASAVAFATGAALESPASGAALAPLAAGVAYSRLHTGAHWFSDVAGGAAIGAGVALALKAAVPVPKPSALLNEAPPTAETIELPALVDGDGAFIVVNPGSGRGLGRPDPRPVIAKRLPKAVVHELSSGDDFAQLVDDALASPHPPRVIGIHGGDGSVGAMATIARKHDLPLLVFPGGTFNHFAKAAMLDSVDVAIDAAQKGEGRAVDVADLRFATGDPITVLNTVSVGIYPSFVEEREKHEKRLGKPIAALIAAVRVLRGSSPLRVEIEGGRRTIWSVFVGVGRYYPVTAAPIERRRLDDGVLDVRVLFAGGKPKTRGAVALALGGRMDALAARLPFLQGPPVLDAFTGTGLTIRSRADDPGYAHDGEASTETPGGTDDDGAKRLNVTLVPGGLRVYSPAQRGK
ncbi:phosphatase PAP2 family protein [Leifsonia sp. NPDC102414]|uniref:bifunctional phosphatase PAP2/diacylglycerol kinase family protein n=1 Tax=unclassified Leifsonia TaxID=2663824 RepID=UPI001F3339F2|nr:bifunctional phosphatase PAP2/diacylglycerol kinase family protein [Leifsonia sp. Root227]